MTNLREQTKRNRLQKLTLIMAQAKEEKKEINKKKLIAMMIVEEGISKKTATEEIEAIMEYGF